MFVPAPVNVVKSEFVDCVVKNDRFGGLSSGGATELGKAVMSWTCYWQVTV